jgi:CHAT domain-containing protein/tetratricopeptide (TPR) repeat protein
MRITRAFVILLIAFPLFLHGQDFNKALQDAIDQSVEGDYKRSLELTSALYDLYPGNSAVYNVIAYNYICLAKPEEAAPYISVALQLEPTDYYAYVAQAYYLGIKGDIQKAKSNLLESIKFLPANFDANILVEEIRLIGIKNNKPVFNELANYYQQTWKTTSQRYPTITDLIVTTNEVANQPEKVKEITRQYATKFMVLGWPDVAIRAYLSSTSTLSDNGFLSAAGEMAQAGYQQYLTKNFRTNYVMASYTLYQLLRTYIASGNDERAVQHLDEVLDISQKSIMHFHDGMSLIKITNAYSRLQKEEENMKWALYTYDFALKAGFSELRALAADALSNAYGRRWKQGGGPNSIRYGEEAVQIAIDHNLKGEISSVMSNLALRYTTVQERGNYEKAIHTLETLAAIEEKEGKYEDLATILNNIGAMYFLDKNFSVAADYFEKSAGFAQKQIDGLNMSEKDKLTFYQSQVSAYDFLTACHANLNNAEGAFYSMERSRSRVLSERMAKGKNMEVPSLYDLQQLLKPDEACIMYSLMSGHEVSILVVTNKHAMVTFHKDDNFIGTIKEKHLDRINKEHRERSGRDNAKPIERDSRVTLADFQKVTQLTRKFFEVPGMADAELTEYLKGYYRFLMLPVANRLTGIKKLMISPNDVLNFIPFEALQQHDGKYLVEKYDVKYMHSTSVLKQIRERQYGERSKPLLAMGGAVFNVMKIDAPIIRDQEDLNMLQLEVEANEKTGASQRKAYSALFGAGPMNALPGTIEEVKNISKIIPSSDVYLGADMSESKIKALTKSGELGKYKVLHLATHGFVVNEIPELSGVAMSIFETEQNGEDGFLNVNEISNLNLKTDLVVLSACQTALGKIYSGEGVTGLTQSLLVAGSNGALVSLWPVNDTSTMLFMSDLYKQSSSGKPYDKVVNDLKRKFIKGDYGNEFKHPNYWAPFVYFGN